MSKVTSIKSVWCQSPEVFALYKNADEGHRLDYISLADNALDMTSCGWIKVGVAEVICTLDPVEDGVSAAIATCDLAEAKLRDELNQKLADISAIRQELLALPAPKGDYDAA